MSAENKSNEIHIIRIYDAPVKAVWEAWTDPAQLAQWWGPRGFTITTHSKDLRPGGIWAYTMHGPDGTDYPNKTTYLDVKKHSLLVYDHGASENTPPLFRVTVHFLEIEGKKTKMDMTMSLPSPEALEETKKIIKKASGYSTWDRLAEHLHKEISNKERFVINRSFDVPMELMYEAWTNPEHFEQWLPPTGFTMKFIEANIEAGKSAFYVMTDGANAKMYGRTEYLELKRPNRIVYTQQFCDDKQNVTRHPLSATWPETMLTTVALTEEGPNRTRVTITWEPHGKITQEELQTFIKAKGGMTQGWTGSFDKLEAYLVKAKK